VGRRVARAIRARCAREWIKRAQKKWDGDDARRVHGRGDASVTRKTVAWVRDVRAMREVCARERED